MSEHARRPYRLTQFVADDRLVLTVSRPVPGRSSTELATLLGDVVKGSFEMYTLQFVGVTDPDMLRRVFHSGQTNVAVFQPDIHGVRPSPIADFTFLKDVYRQAAGSPVRP